MTFTDDPARDYERFCEQQDHGAGDEPPAGGDEQSNASVASVFHEEMVKKALNAPPGSLVSQSVAEVIHDNFVNGVYQGLFDQPDIFNAILRLEAKASAALTAAGDEEGWGSVPEERGKWLTNGTRDAKVASTVRRGFYTLEEELAWRKRHTEGPPKETEWYTQEELEDLGYVGFYERFNADPRGKFWDGGEPEPVRHEELYREDLEAPGEEF